MGKYTDRARSAFTPTPFEPLPARPVVRKSVEEQILHNTRCMANYLSTIKLILQIWSLGALVVGVLWMIALNEASKGF